MAVALSLAPGLAQELALYPEYQRPDAQGKIVRPDWGGRDREINSPAVVRNGYASYIVVAKLREPGPYRFDVAMNPAGRIDAEVYRLWFRRGAGGEVLPDALIPVPNTYFGSIPDAANGLPEQTAVAFWLDLHVPRTARRETVRVEAVLQAFGHRDVYPLEVRILPLTAPDADALEVFCDPPGDAALLREHRVWPLVPLALPGGLPASWPAFDARYGPLLDGSAFRAGKSSARPLPYAPLLARPAVTPAEAGLPAVLSEVENHFGQRGWTQTRLAVGLEPAGGAFPWNHDAAGRPSDAGRLRRLALLLHPPGARESPVRFVQHNESSAGFARQARELGGAVDHWIVSESELRAASEAPALVQQRGGRLWSYADVPGPSEPVHALLRPLARAWVWGASGLVLRQSEGGALTYAGQQWGLEAEVPSVRLKILRNALQDLALLRLLEGRLGAARLREELAQVTAGTKPSDWWGTDGPAAAERALAAATSDWWPEVRRRIYALALAAP